MERLYRSRRTSLIKLLAAAGSLLLALAWAWQRSWFNLACCGAFAAGWIAQVGWLERPPYLTLDTTGLTFQQSALQKPRHVPWDSVRAVETRGADARTLWLITDGAPLRLRLGILDPPQQDRAATRIRSLAGQRPGVG